MLNVILGSLKDSVHYVSDYFDATYDTSWFETSLAKEIIKGIDDSEFIEGEYIKSPVYGGISPRDLSSGCKGVLLLLNMPELIVCGERFGDNCFKWLFEVAKQQDITITLSHYLKLSYSFDMCILNSNTVVHNRAELYNQIVYCREAGLLRYD